MSETCGGNCSSCGEACSERKPESLQAQPNPKSKIGKVIAVVSGKGGVGKSTVSAMLATAMQRTGRRAGVLDADITGPSIPKAFGVSECASADEEGIYPAVTESGIQIMSVNLLLEHEDDPVLWRGPIIAGAVKQFWTDVVWENRPLKWHASWVQNVVRQFGLYLLWAQEICGDPTLVREDRVGQTPGASVVPPGAQPSS